MGDDLLGAERDACCLLGGEGEGFVEGVGVQRLGAPEGGRQGLDGDAGDVVLGLLGGERHAGGLGVEPAHHCPFVGGAVALFHPPGPDAASGTELADLLEEVGVGVEEEREASPELVDVLSFGEGGFDVGESVGEGERQFLRGGRAGFADVVPGDRDGVPLRHLGRGVADHVGHDPHARARGIDVLLLRLVLLQDVVLDRAGQIGLGDATLLADGDVHR